MTLAKQIVAASLAVPLGLAALAGCAAPTAPGMAIVASSGSTSGPGSMLVAFPSSPCTGTDSAVFLDDKGAFVAAVAPGTATYVAFPDEATRLYVFSSRDVTSEPGTWFRRHEVARPPERVEQGILVDVARIDAKNCYRNALPTPSVVSYEVATRATKDLTWLDVRAAEGTRWLDEHRARVTELLAKEPPPKPGITSVTRRP
ncbi:MAG: hypothetical protein JWO86_3611 [Myxococcaceae bacterium]|jgi:hypothetical protein|nr:hypothetical protein [Myxococcaceae bacterium]MEA2748734.1 hypothetical protein [Myxococcales bacterium]